MKLELYKTLDDVVGVENGPLSPIDSLNGERVILAHSNLCDYWSSHILRNCTHLPNDATIQVHNTVFTQDLRSQCACSEPPSKSRTCCIIPLNGYQC